MVNLKIEKNERLFNEEELLAIESLEEDLQYIARQVKLNVTFVVHLTGDHAGEIAWQVGKELIDMKNASNLDEKTPREFKNEIDRLRLQFLHETLCEYIDVEMDDDVPEQIGN